MFEILQDQATSTLNPNERRNSRRCLPSPEAVVYDMAKLDSPRQIAAVLCLAVGALKAHGDEDSQLMKMAAEVTGRLPASDGCRCAETDPR